MQTKIKVHINSPYLFQKLRNIKNATYKNQEHCFFQDIRTIVDDIVFYLVTRGQII